VNPSIAKGPVVAAALTFVVLMCASLVFVLPRVAFERDDRRVLLVVDGAELARAVRAVGVSWDQVGAELAAVGVNSVGIPRLSLNDLAQDGVLDLLPGPLGTPFEVDGSSGTFLRLTGRCQPFAIETTLRTLVPIERRGDFMRVFAEGAVVRMARLFWNRDVAAVLARRGLVGTHRFLNHVWTGDELQPSLLDGVEPGGLVLFDEKHALGWPDRLRQAGELFNGRDLAVGLVEFADQIGVTELITTGSTRSMIVHSISELEMEKYGIERIMPRWIRAVRERRVRAVYMRLFPPENPPPGSGDILRRNVAYFGRVVAALRARGYEPGMPADPRQARLGPENPLLATGARTCLVIGVGMAGGLFLYLAGLLPLRLAVLLKTAGAFTFLLLLYTGWAPLVWKILALGLAVTAPAIAVLSFYRLLEGPPTEAWSTFAWRVLGCLLLMTTVCVAAGLGIHGFMTSPDILLKLDLFSGVKLVYLVPPLLVAWVLVMDERFRPERTAVTWLHVVVAGAVVGAAGIYLLRAGNFSPLPTSAAELAVRDSLDMGLPARPRTKEFLVGYPALLLLALALRRGQRHWSFLFALAGTVAGVSTVNSFCHLTCAPDVNVLRSYMGLVFGALLDRLVPLLTACRRADDEVVVLTTAAALDETARRYGVTTIVRNRPWQVLPELVRCRMLVYGGGSLFQDKTGILSLVYYAAFAVVARLLCVERRLFVAQGVGPVDRPLLAALTAHVAASCDFVQVRDDASAGRLLSWGVPTVEVGADLLLWRRPEDEGGLPERRARFGVALRPDPRLTDARLRQVAEAVGAAARRRKERVQLLAFHPQQDGPLLERFAAALPAEVNAETTMVTAETMYEAVGACRVVVCMRYHAALAAFVTLTPMVGLSYDPKTDGLFDDASWPYWLSVDAVDRTRLDDLFAAIEAEGTALKTRMKDARAPMLTRGRLARERFSAVLEVEGSRSCNLPA